MAKKRSEEEQEAHQDRIDKMQSAAKRQADAALAASKFVKDAIGYGCNDIDEARRWVKAAQDHYAELLEIFNVIEEETKK